MAKSNAAWSPWRNGTEMRLGKKLRPVINARCPAGSCDSTVLPRRCCIGLYPRKAANNVDTGGRWATRSATRVGTPWATSPWYMAPGSEDDNPTIMRVKKMPIDRTWAEFWKVEFMPEPAPRCWGGRLFMTPARLGEPKQPMVRPSSKRIGPKTPYEKLTGRSSSTTKEAAEPTMPPVAKGRAP